LGIFVERIGSDVLGRHELTEFQQIPFVIGWHFVYPAVDFAEGLCHILFVQDSCPTKNFVLRTAEKAKKKKLRVKNSPKKKFILRTAKKGQFFFCGPSDRKILTFLTF